MQGLRQSLLRALSTVVALLTALTAAGQGRVVDDVRVVQGDQQAVITLEFACDMRFVADTPTAGGALLEVRVAPFDSCGPLGIGVGPASESYLPVGAAGAHLTGIEFSSVGAGDSIVLLSFDQPMQYRITQGRTLREVVVTVELPGTRQPISGRVVEPDSTADFMINLQSTREPVSADALDAIDRSDDAVIYVSQVRLEGVLWHRLRLGFFATESEAEAALQALAGRFPRAWIGRAGAEEIRQASESAISSRPSDVTVLAAQEIAPEDIDSTLAAARRQLTAGNASEAIALYQRLVATPGEHRAEAIEFLGLAYERDAQPDRARGEYQRFLQAFPDSPDRARVEQRLNAVLAQQSAPRTALRDTDRAETGNWDWSAGLSQYYRRYDTQLDPTQPALTIQSALLTDVDLGMQRTGGKIDLTSRLSVSHYNDMLSEQQGKRGDQTRTSYAWIDVADSGQNWDVRFGRQSLHNFGVLGRFDGMHFSLGLGSSQRLHIMQGYPVTSTRNSLETTTDFTGVAIEFTDLVGSWDVATFYNTQTTDGITSRSGFGAEARYFDERRSVTAMLDYDVDFSEMNMLLLLGTWRLENRLTFSALFDKRMSPILSARNALIGQPVDSVEELLLVWSEEEVRALARDRTAASQTLTLGLATPLGERLQLNFDMTRSEIDGTVSSGGVEAVPGTGAQMFYSTSLVGTGLFGSSDVSILSFRVSDAETYQSRLISWDARFPVGRKLRINPRIRYIQWESLVDGRQRDTVAPALRLLLNLQSRYRLELEAGRDDSTRSDSGIERESSSSYFYLGYRASF